MTQFLGGVKISGHGFSFLPVSFINVKAYFKLPDGFLKACCWDVDFRAALQFLLKQDSILDHSVHTNKGEQKK